MGIASACPAHPLPAAVSFGLSFADFGATQQGAATIFVVSTL